jgi:hypothetical protein
VVTLPYVLLGIKWLPGEPQSHEVLGDGGEWALPHIHSSRSMDFLLEIKNPEPRIENQNYILTRYDEWETLLVAPYRMAADAAEIAETYRQTMRDILTATPPEKALDEDKRIRERDSLLSFNQDVIRLISESQTWRTVAGILAVLWPMSGDGDDEALEVLSDYFLTREEARSYMRQQYDLATKQERIYEYVEMRIARGKTQTQACQEYATKHHDNFNNVRRSYNNEVHKRLDAKKKLRR